MSINGLTGIEAYNANKTSSVDQTDNVRKAYGLNERVVQQVKEIAGLLASDPIVRVMNASRAQATGETGTATGATGVPAIDNPDDEVAKAVDLEKLICYLKLETDEKQAALAQDRIELQKGSLDKTHQEQMDKINESLKKMDEAQKKSLLSKIFGWIAAAVAVVVAVASCIATGGVAVGAVIGAVVAVGLCIANETDAISNLTEKLVDALKDAGLSKEAAEILGQVIIGVAIAALSLAGGAAGLKSAISNTVENVVAKTVATVASVVGMALGAVNTGVGAAATAANYKSGLAQADVTEVNKYLMLIRQQLDQSQEELEQILEQIQNCYSDIVAVLDSQTDTQKAIAEQIGQIAG